MARGGPARWAVVLAGMLGGLVLLAGGLAGGYAATRGVEGPKPAPTVSAPPLPDLYDRATGAPFAPPSAGPAAPGSPGKVASALASALGVPALGPRVHAQVLDIASGRVLYSRDSGTPAAPASTAKLLTAAAVLHLFPATARFTTEVVRGPGTGVTIVGGGDPTLSCAAPGADTTYPGAARIADLAAALRTAHVTPTRVVVDDSAFAGPTISPAWAPEDVPSDYASAITALVCDGGRDTPTAVQRSTTPDLSAGRTLGADAGAPAVPVARGSAPSGAPVLARVESAPALTLVTQMLHDSDNVIAEMLGRQVAIREKLSPTFTGAAQAIRQVVRSLGVDPGAGMKDVSGLAASDRLTAAGLAALLQRVGASTSADGDVLSTLPVAGWSGTLVDRYRSGTSSTVAGLVRAKTGTLTGVSSLAGVVHGVSGGLYAFAFVADATPATPPAEAALDAAATALARCSCTA